MNFSQLNECFFSKYSLKESDASSSSLLQDLKAALQHAANNLRQQGNHNLKAFEVVFQDVIEDFFPEHSWWEVVDFDIFSDLFANRTPRATIEGIISHVKPEFLAEAPVEECVDTLEESNMSPEDEKDSRVLRDIYLKTQRRANAALSSEEQAMLKKYGLERRTYSKNLHSAEGRPIQLVEPRHKASGLSNVNLADRARKMQDRADYAKFSTPTHFDTPTHADPKYDYYPGTVKNALVRQERDAQNDREYDKVRRMKKALSDRKYYQKQLDDADDVFAKQKAAAEASFKDKMDFIERQHRMSKKWQSDYLDNSKSEIDSLLKRVESLTEGKDLTRIEGTAAHAIASNMNRYHDVASKQDVIDITKDIFSKANLSASGKSKAEEILKILPTKRNMLKALEYVTDDVVNASDNAVIRTKRRYESVEV